MVLDNKARMNTYTFSKSAIATAKILRTLYDFSALNCDGKFNVDWKYRCRNLVSDFAYFTEKDGRVIFACFLSEARKYCKFSENALAFLQDKPDNSNLITQKVSVHGEHVVPVSLAKKIAFRMLEDGATDEQIAIMISWLVEVVFITKEEQKRLDSSVKNGGLGLKTSMPQGWNSNVVDHDWTLANQYSRLEAAQIRIAPETLLNTIR